MASEKKGFVLYFDMLPHLARLSAEQRGHLLMALAEYAQDLAVVSVDIETVLEDYPQLLPETQMAVRFIGSTILRDTEKWLERQRNCQRAARERKEKAAADRWKPPADSDFDLLPDLPL